MMLGSKIPRFIPHTNPISSDQSDARRLAQIFFGPVRRHWISPTVCHVSRFKSGVHGDKDLRHCQETVEASLWNSCGSLGLEYEPLWKLSAGGGRRSYYSSRMT
jgi:hypothetical protein